MVLQAPYEQSLRTDLEALRHLPPGTSIPRLATAEERQLLLDLLRLADDIDPLRWLRQERSELAARLTLRGEIQRLLGLLIGRHRVTEQGWNSVTGQSGELEEFAQLTDTASLTKFLESTRLATAEQLRDVLTELRQTLNRPNRVLPNSADTGTHTLWANLLQLPDSVDPLRWLQREQLAPASRLALQALLEQTRPDPTRGVGTTITALHPNVLIEVSNPLELHVTITEVLFGDAGFAFAADISFGEQSLVHPPGIDDLVLTWRGFDRVYDNRGYQYLRQHRELRSGLLRHQPQEQLRMTFYPGVTSGVRDLTFSAEPVFVEVAGIQRVSNPPPVAHRQRLPSLSGGAIVWRLSVQL